MMARASVEQKVQHLETLSVDDATFASALKKALADKHHRVIAKAARLCQEHYLDQFIPELVAAYTYLLSGDPVKRDANCHAKTTLCEALYELNFADTAFYLAGMRYHQMEPAWSGSVDSGLNIRRICAMGLTITRCPRMNIELLPALYDEEASVRAGAVAAISCLQPSIAEPLLRQKVLGGDEPWILGDCFAALLKLEPDESVNFILSFLQDSDEELVEYAALALGESRFEDAFIGLKQAWEDCLFKPSAFHKILLSGMVLHRSEAAYAHILQVIQSNDRGLAMEALKQLAIYRGNLTLKQQVQDLVLQSERRDLSELFDQVWD